MVTVRQEKAVDYELTARIATDAFAEGGVRFCADRIKWLYEKSFGQGTTVLAAIDDGRKIGQIALIGQRICVNGEASAAVQLVDLFILQAYRSAQLVRRLYREVEQICIARNVRYILALPNDKSVLLNARFLKLNPLLSLPVRAGLSLRRPRGKLFYSGFLKSMTRQQAIALLAGFGCARSENGVHWDGESLFSRTSDPTRDYAVHANSDLLLISGCRQRGKLSYVVLCGFFAQPQAKVAQADVQELVRAACSLWKIPLFVYAGTNDRLPMLPGMALPTRLRRPILVQLRDLKSEVQDVRLDRFQLIDSDFA